MAQTTAATTLVLEWEVGGSRRSRPWPAPSLGHAFVFDAIDLGFGAQGLLLALLFRCGLAEGDAGEPMRFGAVLTGGECDDRVERRGVHV